MKRWMVFCLLVALTVCACRVSVSPLPTAELDIPQVEPSPTPGPTPTKSPEPGPPDPNVPGQVRGRLVDVNGAPLAGVELILWELVDPARYQMGEPIMPGIITDSDGIFFFENIPPGTYSLYSMTWKTEWYDLSTMMPTIIEVKPGETLDLGEVWFTI